MRVLGIETSCDETGIAVYDSERGVIAHALHSQVDMHAVYGGVVPELASRDHVRRIIPLIKTALREAHCTPAEIDGIAYTAGPGLIGALLTGVAVGRSLAFGWDVPAVAVHHMEAHLLAPLLENNAPVFPFIALLVSGGHTQLVRVNRPGDYQLLGESLDDAAGEAFDKTAKLLGLGYPGGPALSALALSGRPGVYHFPRPMTARPGLDFSFSGLKTHAMLTLEQAPDDPQARADIARAFVEAVVDTLVVKCRRALEETGIRTLVAAGGVSANRQLREQLTSQVEKMGGAVYFPRLEFCTDNGAMIAYAGYLRLRAGQSEPLSLSARARWDMEELPAM